MKAKNLNASSVKTRNLIRDTFAELLYEKKNINKITVTELVQRADINRSTFYSHYDDVRHVAEDINVTLEEIIECGKLWCRTMIERRSEKTVMLKE